MSAMTEELWLHRRTQVGFWQIGFAKNGGRLTTRFRPVVSHVPRVRCGVMNRRQKWWFNSLQLVGASGLSVTSLWSILRTVPALFAGQNFSIYAGRRARAPGAKPCGSVLEFPPVLYLVGNNWSALADDFRTFLLSGPIEQGLIPGAVTPSICPSPGQ